MIFEDKLEETGLPLATESDKLFDLALSTQQHEGDLLLLYVNGSYNVDIFDRNNNVSENLSGYVIGQKIKDIQNTLIISS